MTKAEQALQALAALPDPSEPGCPPSVRYFELEEILPLMQMEHPPAEQIGPRIHTLYRMHRDIGQVYWEWTRFQGTGDFTSLLLYPDSPPEQFFFIEGIIERAREALKNYPVKHLVRVVAAGERYETEVHATDYEGHSGFVRFQLNARKHRIWGWSDKPWIK